MFSMAWQVKTLNSGQLSEPGFTGLQGFMGLGFCEIWIF